MGVEETSRGGPEESPRRSAQQLSPLLTRARSGDEAAFRSLSRTLMPELPEPRLPHSRTGRGAADTVGSPRSEREVRTRCTTGPTTTRSRDG